MLLKHFNFKGLAWNCCCKTSVRIFRKYRINRCIPKAYLREKPNGNTDRKGLALFVLLSSHWTNLFKTMYRDWAKLPTILLYFTDTLLIPCFTHGHKPDCEGAKQFKLSKYSQSIGQTFTFKVFITYSRRFCLLYQPTSSSCGGLWPFWWLNGNSIPF